MTESRIRHRRRPFGAAAILIRNRISLSIAPPFPLDIDVRTPTTMEWRLEDGDSFLREVVERGQVLYEKVDGRVVDGRDTTVATGRHPRRLPSSH